MSERRSRQIGARLRRIRHQQGLSLADVQQRSDGAWKAVVVGAYERGDRSISIARLQQLAAFYGVPLAEVLPAPAPSGEAVSPDAPVALDLAGLDATNPGDGVVHAVARFAGHVRRLRGDHNGRVLTLRGGDLVAIAMAAGSDEATLLAELGRRGALLGGTAQA